MQQKSLSPSANKMKIYNIQGYFIIILVLFYIYGYIMGKDLEVYFLYKE